MISKYLVLVIAGILLFVGLDPVAQSKADVFTPAWATTSSSSNQASLTSTGALADLTFTAEAPSAVYSQGVTPVAYYYWNHHWYRYHHRHARLCRTRGWVSGHYNRYGRWVHGHHYCKLWA
jgi:hypothetical protein